VAVNDALIALTWTFVVAGALAWAVSLVALARLLIRALRADASEQMRADEAPVLDEEIGDDVVTMLAAWRKKVGR
jgi:hypothetical protein